MNDDSHDFESVNINIEVLTSDVEQLQHTIGKLIIRVETLVDDVDRLDKQTQFSLKDLDQRMDTMERNHRFMSYKLPDSLSAYYGHKLLPGLNPDDLKEDDIKHEKSKDEDLPDLKDDIDDK